MTKFSTGLMKKALATTSLLTLLIPGVAQAATHFISVNGLTLAPTPISLDGSAANVSVTVNLTDGAATQSLTGNLSAVRANVSICSGTEWLDQGMAAIGVSGTLSGGGYSLVFTTTGVPSPVTGACSGAGSTNYSAIVKTAVLTKDSTQTSTTYNFWNADNTVPEPGTLLLTLMGLLGLGWFSRNRLRNA